MYFYRFCHRYSSRQPVRNVREAALQLKAGEIPANRFKQSTRLPTL